MFSVDLPKGDGDEVLADVVRIVASNDVCVADHTVLLERPLRFGTAVGPGQQVETSLWQVAAATADAAGRGLVTVSTPDGRQVLRLWLSGEGPCTLNVEVASKVQAWGLGQCFGATGARADWIGRRRSVMDANVNGKYRAYGHGTQSYEQGTEGYLQIPVLMVAGGPQPFALILDYVFRIEADFQTNPWAVRLGSDVGGQPTFPVRAYVVGGTTSMEVRRRVMDLLGKPPVPPRKAFGLWMSEYGFENWADVDRVIDGLRHDRYPCDGIVLDLFWFGGIEQTDKTTSEMGNLTWDITDTPGVDDPFFPDPKQRLADYAARHIGFALIEESYVLDTTDPADTFNELVADVPGAFVKVGPTILRLSKEFFGEGAAMLDWTNPAVGAWIHTHRRKPFMVDYGVRVHWTDLGEPEIFHPEAEYHGHDLDGNNSLRTRHADVANVYNLFWHRSIDDGYNHTQDGQDADQRRLLLTRAATAGIQRYGAAVWSGDTSSRMEVLVSQLHNQAHLSCSGIDFYGSDVGGFHRGQLPLGFVDELYTQWFANSAWFDVPLRPHVNNHDFYVNRAQNTPDGPERHRVAPNEVGHLLSNLANLRTRYALIPYYYSLSHQAARTGMPLCPPPGLVYPDDEALAGIAHQKLLGPSVMIAVVAGYGEYARRVYLPKGRWYDFWNGTALDSAGEWVGFVPEYRNGVFRLPTFVCAGAIIPLMHVDEDTLDTGGHRGDGGRFEDLILRVYDAGATATPSSFTVFEDGGESRTQEPRQVAVGHRHEAGSAIVEVGQAGAVDGLADVRPLRVQWVTDQTVSDVQVNGHSWTQAEQPSRTAAGWAIDAEHRIVEVYLPAARVDQAYRIRFVTAGPAPATSSALLVCDHADTDWGEDVYARFVTPLRTTQGQLTEVKLDPSVTYAYLYPPTPGHPTGPVWTLLLDHLQPNQEIRLTFEKRRGTHVIHANPQELFRSSGPGGYVGEIRGTLT